MRPSYLLNPTQCPVQFWASQTPSKTAIQLLADNGLDKTLISYADLSLHIDRTVEQLTSELTLASPKASSLGPLNRKIVGISHSSSYRLLLLFFACLRLKHTFFPVNPLNPDKDKLFHDLNVDLIINDQTSDHSEEPDLARTDEALYDQDTLFNVSNAMATMILTSGSSGQPKPAVHSWENLVSSAHHDCKKMSIQPSDNWLLSLPIFHIGGLMICVRMMITGGTITVPQSKAHINPSTPLLKDPGLLNQLNITCLSVVPAQLRQLIQAIRSTQTSIPSLKQVLVGGSSVSDALLDDAASLGLPCSETYGCTESSAQVIYNHRPLSNVEVTFIDGELGIKGPMMFQGYWNGQTVTKTLTSDAYYPTGDLGYQDPDGRIYITGRKDNMFISGGENIQPEAIEQVLLKHPDVAEATVIPLPHPVFEQVPLAVLTLHTHDPVPSTNQPASPLPDPIKHYLKTLLLPFQIPKYYVNAAEVEPFLASPGIKLSRQNLQSAIIRMGIEINS